MQQEVPPVGPPMAQIPITVLAIHVVAILRHDTCDGVHLIVEGPGRRIKEGVTLALPRGEVDRRGRFPLALGNRYSISTFRMLLAHAVQPPAAR